MNNCPSCKRVPPALELSRIAGTAKIFPPFDCVTLCCPLCGAILMAIPELGQSANEGEGSASVCSGAGPAGPDAQLARSRHPPRVEPDACDVRWPLTP
jgi:hypothetical protein